MRILPSTIVVSTALPSAANTRWEYSWAGSPGSSGVNIALRVSTRITSAFLPADSSPGLVAQRGRAVPGRHPHHVRGLQQAGVAPA